LNLAAFYYHFRGTWWREIVSASQRIRAVKNFQIAEKMYQALGIHLLNKKG
jgi:hypothetical protein